jgi:hypothetical protein
MPADFAAVTAVTRRDDTTFDAVVDPGWTIGGRPNGGYLLAILGRGAAAVSAHEHVITASAQYLRPPEPGPVSLTTEVLRAGRSATQVRAGMRQGAERCVEALIILSTLDPESDPQWDGGAPVAGDLADTRAVPLQPVLPGGTEVAIMEQIDVRLDADTIGFSAGRPSGRGELRGWLELRGGGSFDPISLLFAVDAFPPSSFDIEFAGWVPTLELTAYVRALPAAGPVRIVTRTQLIEGQRLDEVCTVWDCRGRLVAQATQLAAIRLG